MEKLLFIASIQYGEPPTGGGVQTKNQLILSQIQKYYQVKFFDTWNKNSIVSLLSALFLILCFKRKTVLSISARGALSIVYVLNLLHTHRSIYFIVPGGFFGSYVERHPKYIPVLKTFRKILVQGHYMKRQLNDCGLTNVSVLLNCKPIGKLPFKAGEVPEVIKFVFLGRLIEDKGIGLIIKAFQRLQKKYPEKCSVTFFGSPSEQYNKAFFDKLNDKYIVYGGFLDLKSEEGITNLAKYDVMVFPTYFEGEGFPGVLIDAFKAGLPVIASDFHANPEVVSSESFGKLIKANDVERLELAMEEFITHPMMIKEKARAVQQEVLRYDISEILSKDNLHSLLS